MNKTDKQIITELCKCAEAFNKQAGIAREAGITIDARIEQIDARSCGENRPNVMNILRFNWGRIEFCPQGICPITGSNPYVR